MYICDECDTQTDVLECPECEFRTCIECIKLHIEKKCSIPVCVCGMRWPYEFVEENLKVTSQKELRDILTAQLMYDNRHLAYIAQIIHEQSKQMVEKKQKILDDLVNFKDIDTESTIYRISQCEFNTAKIIRQIYKKDICMCECGVVDVRDSTVFAGNCKQCKQIICVECRDEFFEGQLEHTVCEEIDTSGHMCNKCNQFTENKFCESCGYFYSQCINQSQNPVRDYSPTHFYSEIFNRFIDPENPNFVADLFNYEELHAHQQESIKENKTVKDICCFILAENDESSHQFQEIVNKLSEFELRLNQVKLTFENRLQIFLKHPASTKSCRKHIFMNFKNRIKEQQEHQLLTDSAIILTFLKKRGLTQYLDEFVETYNEIERKEKQTVLSHGKKAEFYL